MQATYEKVQNHFRECCEGVTSPLDPRPKERFQQVIEHAVGLCDENGTYYEREDGFPTLAKDRKHRASDFPIALLAEAMLGREWERELGLHTPGVKPQRRRLQEEALVPIGPSMFTSVNAWQAAIGALVQAQGIEGYETAPFDLADLFPTRTPLFWNGGERYTDIVGPFEPAPKVGVAESHPDAQLSAVWVEPGPLAKYGNKLTIARETAFADINGRLMERARQLGESIKYRENELALDIICGQTNNFKLGLLNDTSATGYNTFGATVPTGNGTTGTLANDLTNPMLDPITTFQASDDALGAYKHPVTGLPMPVDMGMNTILLPHTLNNWAMFLNGLGDLTILNQPGVPAPAPAGTFPTGSMTSPNPYRGRFQIRVSRWLYERHTRSTTQTNPNISAGLGLTAANARRWYRLDPARFAVRRAAWEMDTKELNPNDSMMADQNIVWGQVVNVGVQYQVLNPWSIQRNKVS